VAANTRAIFVPDILGSVIGTYDSSSGSLSKVGYLPYGKSAPSPGPFGFTGQRFDPETSGLYYYRARHYSPAWGRFIQPDPIGHAGGSNPYTYVGNDPLNLRDSTGLSADTPRSSGETSSSGELAAAGSFGELAAGLDSVTADRARNGSSDPRAAIILAAADDSMRGARRPEIIGGGGGGGFSRGGPTPVYQGGVLNTESILAPGGSPVGVVSGGATPNIRTVDPGAFQSIRSDLLSGAIPTSSPLRYPGVAFERPDGTVFGIRNSSESGLTIDILRSNSPSIPNGFKIHQ